MLSGVGFAMINTQPEEKRGKRLDVLPLSLPPRGLSREQSAAYIGVSPSTFDKLVSENLMPGPKRLRNRTVWDRKRLDECFEALDDNGDNPWD